jgi:predicted transcriptional regulator
MKSARKNKIKTAPKNKVLDTAPKKEVKEMFMKWFKKNNSVGQIMTKRDVVENIIAKLDAKQNDALEKAMNELRKEGLIEVKEDGVTLVLTQKGAEFTGN